MKKLDKQIVSALAIGIGAGLMMCPVTAYADEGEPNENNNDDPVTTQAGDEQKSEENSEVQETAEAAEAISKAAAAVDSAQDAVPTAPAGETNGYENANAALNSAENQINDAATELGDAQDALDTAQRDIETAGAQDKIVDDKATEIENDYGKTISDAQNAIDIVNGIDVDTDSKESAQEAVKDAQKKVEDADKAFSDAETAEAEATIASEAAKNALDDIETQKEDYDNQIEAAEHDLAMAETALIIAADDLANKQSAAEIALSNLDGELGKQIVDLRKAISDASDENIQDKVDELGKLIVDNFVLVTEDDKEAYKNGDFSFTYSLDESGQIVVTKVEEKSVPDLVVDHPEGYFDSYGIELDKSHYDTVIIDEKNGNNSAYAYNESESWIIDRIPVEPYIEAIAGSDGTEWTEFNGTDDVEHIGEKVVTTYNHNGSMVDAVKESYYKIYTTTDYKKIIAHTTSPDYHSDLVRQEAMMVYSEDVITKEFAENPDYEGWEISNIKYDVRLVDEEAARPSYKCYVEVTISRRGIDQQIASKEVYYKADRYNFVEAWTEIVSYKIEVDKTVVDSAEAVTTTIDNYNTKVTAAQDALDKAGEATTAYNNALEKVKTAKEKVKVLSDSFVSETDVKNAKDAHTAALAHLDSAKDKKTAAENKLKDAKEALDGAADKIKAIDERILAQQQAAQNNEGDGQSNENPTGNGTATGDSGSSGNGSSSDGGNSGNDTVTDDQPQIVPTIAGATKADNGTETNVTPLVAGANATVTRTAPTTRRAQMSQLAQSLSDEVKRINDAEKVQENSEDTTKVLASTDAGSKAGKNVSKDFTSSVDGAAANIEDEETALSATATNNSVKFPIIFALLGAIVAGVSVSEYLRMKKEDNELF
ncbi:MAG: hypothetical protein E7305_07235 [Butyrivibrio sp.]|nr:hypothetical protein [Butyrivibrio sp.]